MAIRKIRRQGVFPLWVVVGLLGISVAGCRPHDSAILARGVPISPGVPLSSARDQINSARELDSAMRLGFFGLPISQAGGRELTPEFVSALRREVSPASWNLPGRTISREGGWLVVTQSPEILNEIADWAEARRELEDATHPMVQAEVRVISLPAGGIELVQAAGIESHSTDVGTQGREAPKLYRPSEAQLETLLENDEASSIAAPRVVAVSGQPVSLQVLNERAYLSSYDVYQVEKSSFADPTIDVVQEGLSIELTATSQADQTVDVAFDVKLADLLSMDRTTVKLDPELDALEIEMPNTRVMGRTLRFKTRSGDWLLFPVTPKDVPAVDRSEVTEEDFSEFSTKVPWVAVRMEIVAR